MNVPITKVEFDQREADAVAAVLRSGWIMQGPQVAAFEKAVAGYVGAREAVAVSSCTTALHLSLLALGVKPGDEVIVPSLSFIATANAVLYCGATPVFADLDLATYNLDPAKVERAITKRTKAIMPVDQIGLPADLGRLTRLAARHGLPLLEDAACALGATYQGARVGALSHLTCFSFHPRKIITTGEGGMITTDDTALAGRLRILRSQGASKAAYDREGKAAPAAEVYAELGYNYRMTDVQAAIGLVQLSKLDRLIARRRALAARYDRALGSLRGVQTPAAGAGSGHIYQSYMIRITAQASRGRDEALALLQAAGVGAKASVQAIHLEPLYQARFGKIRLPVTEQVFREGLILPLFPSMTEAEQDHVVSTMAQLLGGARGRGRGAGKKKARAGR